MTNILVYCGSELITAVKSFKVAALRCLRFQSFDQHLNVTTLFIVSQLINILASLRSFSNN
jgi:hypothetical protein